MPRDCTLPNTFLLNETIATIAGIAIGIVNASILSYGVFIIGMKINLRKFFYYTSLLLIILLAGGLAGYGIHKLIEYYEYIGLR